MKGVDDSYKLGRPDSAIVIRFFVSSWCNYRCAYCRVYTDRKGARHAFDNHPAERWIDAFRKVKGDFTLEVTGGEPFLDHANFFGFIEAIGRLERCRLIRIDTNGTWSTQKYAALDEAAKGKVRLNISYHPSQVTLDAFKESFASIHGAGWNVEMINFVMEDKQRAQYEEARDFFRDRFGVYVNSNPDFMAKDPERRQRYREEFSDYLPERDLFLKTGMVTKGKKCFFPSIGFNLTPEGKVTRACVGGLVRFLKDGSRSMDFLAESGKLKPLMKPVSCPRESCSCLDMYAFLLEMPDRGNDFNLLGEYAKACVRHQEQARKG